MIPDPKFACPVTNNPIIIFLLSFMRLLPLLPAILVHYRHINRFWMKTGFGSLQINQLILAVSQIRILFCNHKQNYAQGKSIILFGVNILHHTVNQAALHRRASPHMTVHCSG